jgi:hypothetical protein
MFAKNTVFGETGISKRREVKKDKSSGLEPILSVGTSNL